MQDPHSFKLVFDDGCVIVAEKPAGLLAVPGRGADKQDCLAARVQAEFPDARVVHRLDMATSGLMVFARGASTQRALSQAFHDRQVEKRYVALVGYRMRQTEGEISLPLMADWPNRPLQKVDHDAGKHALTCYRVLAYDAGVDVSRLELEPVTGRTHQLRVHLAALGHPIVGDALYGGIIAHRLMLHAGYLGFAHPATGEAMVFSSAAPF